MQVPVCADAATLPVRYTNRPFKHQSRYTKRLRTYRTAAAIVTQSAANIRRCRAGGLFSAAVVRRTMKQLYDDRAKFGARYCYQRVLTRAYIKRNQISRVSIVLIDRTAQTQT